MNGIVLLVALALAVFVLFKLYSVLGTRTGHEKPPSDIFKNSTGAKNSDQMAESGTVIRLPKPKSKAKPDINNEPIVDVIPEKLSSLPNEIAESVKGFLSVDASFDADEFLEGAKLAYEYIIQAYAKEDMAQLKMLLAQDVYQNFSDAIRERQSLKYTLETTLVSIDKASILEAELQKTTASITVEFQLKLIHVTKDTSGTIVDGDAQAILDVVDVWTFSRDLKSRNPTWTLIATEAMEDTFS